MINLLKAIGIIIGYLLAFTGLYYFFLFVFVCSASSALLGAIVFTFALFMAHIIISVERW